MSKKAGTALSVMAMIFMGALASPLTVLAADAEETYQPALYATIWALLPPLVAIILALITKEVYSSLFVGIVVGALLYSGFKFEFHSSPFQSWFLISGKRSKSFLPEIPFRYFTDHTI